MYTGFNLKITEKDFGWDDYNNFSVNYSRYFFTGLCAFNTNRYRIAKCLNSYLLGDGSINGADMQNDWFPEINADIFISHSHKDVGFATAIAGYLQEKFGLTSFIDSCVWGYADDLLREIDKEYCTISDNNRYDYQRRNQSTSHVHMMLAVSLAKMLDKTEVLFLLKTDNAIAPKNVIPDSTDYKDETFSPWIYFEMGLFNLVKKPLNRLLTEETKGFLGEAGTIQIRHQVDIIKNSLGVDEFNDWLKRCDNGNIRQKEALDRLYSMFT